MKIQKGTLFNKQNLNATIKAMKATGEYVSLEIRYHAYKSERIETNYFIWVGKLDHFETFNNIEDTLEYLNSFA